MDPDPLWADHSAQGRGGMQITRGWLPPAMVSSGFNESMTYAPGAITESGRIISTVWSVVPLGA